MLGERNRQRQREEAERRRREEAERKRREEERRRRERIERERRIQEQISKEADDLRNKLGRAAEKRRLNTSLSGREQQHQRSHVLAQTVEDDAEGIQYKEVKIVLYMCSTYIKRSIIGPTNVIASGSEITPCNKICKPLVVYRFTGNVMTSITTLRTRVSQK